MAKKRSRTPALQGDPGTLSPEPPTTAPEGAGTTDPAPSPSDGLVVGGFDPDVEVPKLRCAYSGEPLTVYFDDRFSNELSPGFWRVKGGVDLNRARPTPELLEFDLYFRDGKRLPVLPNGYRCAYTGKAIKLELRKGRGWIAVNGYVPQLNIWTTKQALCYDLNLRDGVPTTAYGRETAKLEVVGLREAPPPNPFADWRAGSDAKVGEILERITHDLPKT